MFTAYHIHCLLYLFWDPAIFVYMAGTMHLLSVVRFALHSDCICVLAGVYLPLTAVLGGLLFVRVDGYLEADRDVIRLHPHVPTMQAQQGYVCCMPQAVPYRGTGRETYVAPLHCCVRVLPSQVSVALPCQLHLA